ncbi:GDP-mannose 4,6-dehydratase [Candidatus Saccharibacteria bacterium]|nr:GDP-mannose 4,6-dehydratase [Candidatus Saccharibacteria bacterium]
MSLYCITGGAGFIGSTLAQRLLKEGDGVVVIDNYNDYYDPKLKKKNVRDLRKNKNFWFYKCDIRDGVNLSRIFEKHKFDFVVHLAAMAGVRPSIDNPVLYQDVNGIGTQNILEIAKKFNIKKIIMASSSSVYGNCKEVPFSEDMLVDYAISPYAATKKANEVMAHVYHKLFNMDIVMLRFFTVYGPKQRPDLAINKFTRMMINNEEIPMFGDGTTSRDYTYIDDIVDGICKTFRYLDKNQDVYEIINLGSNNPISLKEMIQTIGETLGVEPRIRQLPMQPGDVDRTYADISKARRLLGYEPKTDFKDGIARFVEWYKENKLARFLGDA